MKPTTQPTVSDLIDTHHIYKAIVKAVGYGMIPCGEVIETLKDVIAKFGQPAVDAAGRDLLDIEKHDGVGYAKLKPDLHNACRMLVGPTPAEWPTWWKNADGSERKGKPAVWPPVLPGPPTQKEPKRTKTVKPGPPLTREQVLATLTEQELGNVLRSARERYNLHSPGSKAGQEAGMEIEDLYVEYRRRGLTTPVLQSGKEPKRRTRKKAG